VQGFFYNRYEKPRERAGELGTETDANLNQLLYYHLVGTKQSEDSFLLAEPENPEWMLSPSVSDDGRYLLPPFLATSLSGKELKSI
jgi:prolyl oligopeptidase